MTISRPLPRRRVVLTRAKRGAEAETVPSRWLNRLVNLMAGLPDRQGPEALAAMRARGDDWLGLAAAYDRAPEAAAPPSAPRPARRSRRGPKKLSVTEIKTLIRDPYAIYATHVLKLRPLDPLRPEADPRLRGMVLHEILEVYLRQRRRRATRPLLSHRRRGPCRAGRLAPGPHHLARADRQGGRCVPGRSRLQLAARRCCWRKRARSDLPGLDFTLTGKPDRIDRLDDGRLLLIDYKTGDPPSAKQQQHFDKQLLLARRDGRRRRLRGPWPGRGRTGGLCRAEGRAEDRRPSTLNPGQVAEVWAEFGKLMAAYARPGQGYTARRALEKVTRCVATTTTCRALANGT